MKKMIIGLLVLTSFSAFAGPTGRAEIYETQGPSAIVGITGSAAKFLFESLKVKGVKPPFSNQIIKTFNNVECVKQSSKHECFVGVDLK